MNSCYRQARETVRCHPQSTSCGLRAKNEGVGVGLHQPPDRKHVILESLTPQTSSRTAPTVRDAAPIPASRSRKALFDSLSDKDRTVF